MANRRMLSRRKSLSKKFSRVSIESEWVWDRILPFTDDIGRFTNDLEEIRAITMPMGKQGKQIPLEQIERGLSELIDVGLITNHDGYIEFAKFHEHQTLKNDRTPRIEYGSDNTIGIQWNPTESIGALEVEVEVEVEVEAQSSCRNNSEKRKT